MAGYMTKLQGYIYEGELSNGTGEAVENGVLLVAGEAGKLVKPAADGDTKLLCKEVTHIYDNVVAYRMVVLGLAKTYYLVENGHDVHDGAEYDATDGRNTLAPAPRPLDEIPVSVAGGQLTLG